MATVNLKMTRIYTITADEKEMEILYEALTELITSNRMKADSAIIEALRDSINSAPQ